MILPSPHEYPTLNCANVVTIQICRSTTGRSVIELRGISRHRNTGTGQYR
jgi:hypothetical protein